MENSKEIAKHYNIMREELLRPSIKFQQSLKISIDGDKWCVLMGDNLMEGVVGFGDSCQLAMNDFDINFNKEIKKSPLIKNI